MQVTCDGSFRGESELTFTPVDDTHTRIRMHWRTNPVGVWGLLLRFFDVEKLHSDVVQQVSQGWASTSPPSARHQRDAAEPGPGPGSYPHTPMVH